MFAIAILAVGFVMDVAAYHHAVVLPDSLPLQPFGKWHFMVRILTIVFFITWLDRVYGNIPALGHKCEHPRIWATLAPIIPPFCFVRPCQLMDEAWRAATPMDERESGLWLGYLWWIVLWSAPVTLFALALQTPERLKVLIENARLLNGINIAAAALGIGTIYSLTARQRAAADEIQRLRAAEAVAEARARKTAMLNAAATQADVVSGSTQWTSSQSEDSSDSSPFVGGFVERRAVPRTPTRVIPIPGPRQPVRRRRGAFGDFVALLDAISAPVWISVLTWSTCTAGVAMLLAGAWIILIADGSKFVGGVYAMFGLTFVGVALLLRQQHDHVPERWRVLAAAAALITILNLVLLPGFR